MQMASMKASIEGTSGDKIGSTSETSSAACDVCNRSIPRALACVDTSTGTREILCPVHYRQRHFQKIFKEKKSERRVSWTPRPTTNKIELDALTSPAPSMPPPTTSKTIKQLATPATIFDMSPPTGESSIFEVPSPELPYDSVGPNAIRRQRMPKKQAGRRFFLRLSALVAARDTLIHADDWYCAACKKRAFAQLRCHRSNGRLAEDADAFRVSRFFHGFLRFTLWNALRRAESEELFLKAIRRRGLTAFGRLAVRKRRLRAADHYRDVRCKLAFMVSWRAYCLVGFALHRMVSAASEQAQRRVKTAYLTRWRRGTKLDALQVLRGQIADDVCKRSCVRCWKAWAANPPPPSPEPPPPPPLEPRDAMAARQAIMLLSEKVRACEAKAEEAERRAIAAEGRASAAEGHASGLEASLKEAKEANESMKLSFEKERDGLLEQLGKAMERRREELQQQQQPQQQKPPAALPSSQKKPPAALPSSASKPPAALPASTSKRRILVQSASEASLPTRPRTETAALDALLQAPAPQTPQPSAPSTSGGETTQRKRRMVRVVGQVVQALQ